AGCQRTVSAPRREDVVTAGLEACATIFLGDIKDARSALHRKVPRDGLAADRDAETHIEEQEALAALGQTPPPHEAFEGEEVVDEVGERREVPGCGTVIECPRDGWRRSRLGARRPVRRLRPGWLCRPRPRPIGLLDHVSHELSELGLVER